MARQPKLRLLFSEKSLQEHLQQMYMALNDRINKCNRQMTILSNLIKTPTDAITLQNVLANTEKAIATAQSQRIELLKIQKDVIATFKKEERKKVESNEAVSEEQMIALQRQFAEIRKSARKSEGDF